MLRAQHFIRTCVFHEPIAIQSIHGITERQNESL